MARFSVARVEGANTGSSPVTVSGVAVTVFVAVVAIVPPLVSTLVDRVTKSDSSRAQIEQQRADLQFKKQTASDEWLRKALVLDDDSKRAAALLFLLDTNLVLDEGGKLRSRVAQAPHLKAQSPPEAK